PYRLPTEAEWEYACRAGTTTAFHFGDSLSSDQANHSGTGKAWRTPVGSYPGNAFGLHDMHGKVWEWCADWHGAYPPHDVVDPQGPEDWRRVVRGGSWISSPRFCSSAWRLDMSPDCRPEDEYGLRVCFNLEP